MRDRTWRRPSDCGACNMLKVQTKFGIGQVVRHKVHPFRGVVFDIDPRFDNTEEWWQAIPEEHRPSKEQPYYHLFAENDTSYYIAYVSEQNLIPDTSGEPVEHPDIADMFEAHEGDHYQLGGALH